MTERFTFRTLPSGIGPTDFGTLCSGWAVERAERLLSEVVGLGPSPDTTEEFSIVNRVQQAPEHAAVLFTALFATTYAVHVRVVMKVPRDVFAAFKDGLSDSLTTAMARHGMPPSPQVVQLLQLFMLGGSIALENDLQATGGGNDDAIDLGGSETSRFLIDMLMRSYAKEDRQSKRLAGVENLALHTILSNAPMALMLGLETDAALALVLDP